jgi:hypothetical protein
MKKQLQSGVVVHSCNPALRKLRQEEYEFKASLGYLVGPHLKERKKKFQPPQPLHTAIRKQKIHTAKSFKRREKQ